MKERRINSILFWVMTFGMLLSFTFSFVTVIHADERDWQEKIERMDVELAQKLQREPIEVELQQKESSGSSETNIYYTTPQKIKIKVVGQTVTKDSNKIVKEKIKK